MSTLRPKLGVIEGFYGKAWPWESRRAMARWLPALGIDHYLYAPKSDQALRRGWSNPWPQAEREQLTALVTHGQRHGLKVGLGLSPFDIYRQYGDNQRRALQRRVEEIVDTGVSLLALLFDDMPGQLPDLALRQAEVVADVLRWSGFNELLVCPTYYSADSVLDQLFGQRPDDYLADLGAALPAGTALFWTGSRVVSERVALDDLPSPAERGGAALALWDNYPVNDSRARSEHLYLAPLTDRDPRIAGQLSWHWCNAMNQAALSLPALSSLASLYGQGTGQADSVMQAAGLSDALTAACALLESGRPEELPQQALDELAACAEGEGLAARELAAFLAGEYVFDPACLTD